MGTGAADKRQVAYMVRTLTQLDHDPHPDHAADALACAICHVNLSRTRALTGGEFYQQRNRILMISQLHGTLVESTMGSAVVDVGRWL